LLLINDHIKAERLKLRAAIAGRIIIYLDTKFWIILREQNRKTDPYEKQLLHLVFRLYDVGKCVFPISEITFWEILKQHDKVTLYDTVNLVDKLSSGLSIINLDERVQVEVSHFFQSKNENETNNLNELIWSKLAWILGFRFLSQLKTEIEQKNFFDFVGKISFAEMLKIIDVNGGIRPFTFKDNIQELNQNKRIYEGENRTIDAMFLSELSGYIDHFKDSLSEAIYKMFYEKTGRYPTDDEKGEVDTGGLSTFIYNEFKLKKITNELPSLRIVPELFAAARWDKGRKFSDGNDTMDFLHASFALPYCNYFFTERELHSLIIQRHLDKLYNCTVESSQKKVIDILNAIK
jgi:hypothetical protein